MDFFLIFIWGLSSFLNVPIVAQSISHTFKASETLGSAGFFNAIMETLTTHTETHCAAICSGKPPCWGFKFYSANKSCHMRYGTEISTGMADFISYTKIGKRVCPEDFTWIVELDFCYKVFGQDSERKTWDDAQKTCEMDTEGGRLVILDSVEKHAAVIKSVKAVQGSESTLVGARGIDYVYRWLDGQPVDQITWCPGQPNRKSQCGSLWGTEGFCMDDDTCDSTAKFVCEKVLE